MAEVKWRVKIDVPADSAKAAAGHVEKLRDSVKATEHGAKDLKGEIHRLREELEHVRAPAEIRKLRKEIEEARHAHGGLGHAITSVGKLLGLEVAGFHSVGIAASEARASTHEFLEFIGAEVALEVLKELGEKVFEVGEEMVRAAAKAQRMNRVINIAAGGEEAGENTRKWLEKFSKGSEFSEAANESAYVKLKRVGIEQQQAGLMMKAAADIAAVSENKDEAYQEAISAFERAQVTGKVEARQLRPLGIGVKDIKALGGKYANMDLKTLNKTLAEGKFDQNDIYKLIMSRAQETKLGQRSTDNVDLLSTKMEKLTELPERFFKKLADTKAVGKLGDAIDGVLEKFDPDSPSGAKGVASLESMLTSVAEAVEEIDFAAVADTITNDVIPAVREVVALVGPLARAIEKVASFTHTTLSGFHVVGKALSDPLGAGADLIHGKGVQQSAYDKLGSAGRLPSQGDQPSTLRDLTGVTLVNKYLGGNYLRDTVLNPDWWNTKGGDAASAASEVGANVAEGMASGIQAGAPAVSESATMMSSAAEEASRAALQTHSPSVVFEDIGAMTAAGMARGIGKGSDSVATATEQMVSIPGAISGGGGPISLTINAPVYLAHGGQAEGAAARDAFTKGLREQVIDIVEQAVAAAGR